MLKQVDNHNEKTVNQATSEENLAFPLDLMKCTEIRIGGDDTIFTDQTGKCIVSAVKTGGGILKFNSFDYTAFDRREPIHLYAIKYTKRGFRFYVDGI